MASYPRSKNTEQSIIPMCSKQSNAAQANSKRSSAPLSQKDNPERLRTSYAHSSTDRNVGKDQSEEIIGMHTLLTIPQVAQQLNVCRAHVYKLINQGLPTIHLGRSVRISAISLHSWLSAQEEMQ
jgi:excisionase family DNA binding protein